MSTPYDAPYKVAQMNAAQAGRRIFRWIKRFVGTDEPTVGRRNPHHNVFTKAYRDGWKPRPNDRVANGCFGSSPVARRERQKREASA